MPTPRYKPTTPDKRIRELRKEFKALRKQEAGVERAEQLALFTRAAHVERQLNMAMHTAQLCLEEDPDDPDLLAAAYLGELEPEEDGDPLPVEDDPEAELRALLDLRDLARYLDRDDLHELADERFNHDARRWVEDGDDQERGHRLRTLASMASQEFADTVRDELRYLD